METIIVISNNKVICILSINTVFLFVWTGDDGGKQPAENGGLQKESENVYTLWCSGRTNMEGMLVELKFIKVMCFAEWLVNLGALIYTC